MRSFWLFTLVLTSVFGYSCGSKPAKETVKERGPEAEAYVNSMQTRLSQYEEVELTANLDALSANQKKALKLMIKAGNIMDGLFWYESYGNKGELLDSLFWRESDKVGTDLDLNKDLFPMVRRFAEINYGPWDRLDANAPFVKGVGAKPLGANFYPKSMTKSEFESWSEPKKSDAYSLVRRDGKGGLRLVPYHEVFKRQIDSCALLLEQTADLVANASFSKYLKLRADALRSDEYRESDLAWMDVRDNHLDLVIGPIETYEDKLFGYRAAHEAFVLVKDLKWSKRLDRIAKYLPEMQKGLPVPEKYKQDSPGSDSDLGAYDAVFFAGDCNAGGKTIAINLPNDEYVQQRKGARRLQLKNVMRLKYDKIMEPISKVLIDESQAKDMSFEAFFSNTMFHEVAHGLGVKNVISGNGTVRKALMDQASAMEEGKADVLGLYLVNELLKKGELEGDIRSNYVTFMAGMFRSIRFGASSAHGKANLVRYNYFKRLGAFERNSEGRYKVDFVKFEKAVNSLSADILKLQGDGDYDKVAEFQNTYGTFSNDLSSDLARLENFDIPKDLIFKQGDQVLGLDK